jgi:hypothetical protein
MSSLELPSVAWLGLNWLGTGGFELKKGERSESESLNRVRGLSVNLQVSPTPEV